MKRLTKGEIDEIKKIVASGKHGIIISLARELGLSKTTIHYWTNKGYRERHKFQVQKWNSKNRKKYLEYQKKYYNDHKI